MEERKLITRDGVKQLGFIKTNNISYNKNFVNVQGYIDEISINFHDNIDFDCSISIKQRKINSKDIPRSYHYIFFRDIKFIDELNQLIQVLTGVENK